MSLHDQLKLLRQCDQLIDLIELEVWLQTYRITRDDDARRRLLVDSGYNQIIKWARDKSIWGRNQIAVQLGLPWRNPHDFAPRGYQLVENGIVVCA